MAIDSSPSNSDSSNAPDVTLALAFQEIETAIEHLNPLTDPEFEHELLFNLQYASKSIAEAKSLFKAKYTPQQLKPFNLLMQKLNFMADTYYSLNSLREDLISMKRHIEKGSIHEIIPLSTKHHLNEPKKRINHSMDYKILKRVALHIISWKNKSLEDMKKHKYGCSFCSVFGNMKDKLLNDYADLPTFDNNEPIKLPLDSSLEQLIVSLNELQQQKIPVVPTDHIAGRIQAIFDSWKVLKPTDEKLNSLWNFEIETITNIESADIETPQLPGKEIKSKEPTSIPISKPKPAEIEEIFPTIPHLHYLIYCFSLLNPMITMPKQYYYDQYR